MWHLCYVLIIGCLDIALCCRRTPETAFRQVRGCGHAADECCWIQYGMLDPKSDLRSLHSASASHIHRSAVQLVAALGYHGGSPTVLQVWQTCCCDEPIRQCLYGEEDVLKMSCLESYTYCYQSLTFTQLLQTSPQHSLLCLTIDSPLSYSPTPLI